MKNKYKITTFIVTILICLIIIFLHLLSHEKTQKIYIEQTEKAIIDLKKDFLKYTVNNIFLEIDRIREIKYNNYNKNTEARLKRFEDELDLPNEEFTEFVIDRFESGIDSRMWTAFLWDNETGDSIYISNCLYTESIDRTVKNLKTSLSTYAVIEKGSMKGIFGVSKFYINEIVKNEVGDLIRSREFSNDSYIWVNEIINYKGGKNYAIRRIHPNLKDTEGMYLSTDMEDIKGNLPYLEELEGINQNGELFFTYFFQKLNSDHISEKITYAKLYKDYNWIIAMGIHIDDITLYTEKVNEEISNLSTEFIFKLVGYILIALLIGFTILNLIQKKYLLSSTQLLEKEIDIDTLTKVYSRRCGERKLDKYFEEYMLTKENSVIMVFDIDNFKNINDTYGHKAGDVVLRELSNVINNTIRSSDQLIRWGGDEFIGIFPGLKEEYIMEFGKKLIDKVSSLKISIENRVFNVTISVGFSYFKDSDNDYNDVLKRADDAMYISKREGKNKSTIII